VSDARKTASTAPKSGRTDEPVIYRHAKDCPCNLCCWRRGDAPEKADLFACSTICDPPVHVRNCVNGPEKVDAGDEGYEDAFDTCPEPTCPLYDRAVMADHRHLRGAAKPDEASS
jgi:hypothetical protein